LLKLRSHSPNLTNPKPHLLLCLVEVYAGRVDWPEERCDRATRYLYEKILLKIEERAYHLDHFLAQDSLTFAFVGS